MHKKITGIYFSPTGNTEKYVMAASENIGDVQNIIDLTVNETASKQIFTSEDFVVIGTPVYGGRIPSVARERFLELEGTATPCLVLVTYGNRDYDDALLELTELMDAKGFLIKGACALVARHTYGEIQITRPNQQDLDQVTAFAQRVTAKPSCQEAILKIPGNHPYRDGGNGGKFSPSTLNVCTKCGLCVHSCPVGAIAQDCCEISEMCLSCFRCIRICPSNAKCMLSDEYHTFSTAFSEKLKEPNENHFFEGVISV